MRTGSHQINRSLAVVVALASALPLATSTRGQVPRDLPRASVRVLADSGQLVRVQLPNTRTLVGRVMRFRQDTLVLAVHLADEVRLIALPRASVTQAWVSVGHSHRTGLGIGIGLLAGTTLGAVLGAASFTPCQSQAFMGCFMEPSNGALSALEGGAIGGLVGGIVGGIAGAASVRQHWQQVDVPAGSVGSSGGRGRAGLALSARTAPGRRSSLTIVTRLAM